MKRLSFLIIGILFLLLVAGCGKTGEAPTGEELRRALEEVPLQTGPTDTPETMPFPSTPPPGY